MTRRDYYECAKALGHRVNWGLFAALEEPNVRRVMQHGVRYFITNNQTPTDADFIEITWDFPVDKESTNERKE